MTATTDSIKFIIGHQPQSRLSQHLAYRRSSTHKQLSMKKLVFLNDFTRCLVPIRRLIRKTKAAIGAGHT
ncbi:hypothetical protein MJO28_005845 [Puccinia striiformis f. sp. tritici]|uniref:Uncharacterized protein n=1 Tax=Puccinia striiformis f. sp. tritici TaxID=168172 RepID=A0ACC0EFD8_9BASI|nr:hypothetical protein MJO28_005845 [Puccinia striiformis f. sp. tritici]KAI7957644.1 hypothetical protein MJO29_005861 [Puccinia striiformis f. sp. tritici]